MSDPNSLRPFDDSRISGGDLETLRDWLKERCALNLVIGGEYTVGELVGDLDRILDGMWSDGVDAMGEDA